MPKAACTNIIPFPRAPLLSRRRAPGGAGTAELQMAERIKAIVDAYDDARPVGGRAPHPNSRLLALCAELLRLQAEEAVTFDPWQSPHWTRLTLSQMRALAEQHRRLDSMAADRAIERAKRNEAAAIMDGLLVDILDTQERIATSRAVTLADVVVQAAAILSLASTIRHCEMTEVETRDVGAVLAKAASSIALAVSAAAGVDLDRIAWDDLRLTCAREHGEFA